MPTVFCFSSRLGSLQAAKKVTDFPLRAAIFFFFLSIKPCSAIMIP